MNPKREYCSCGYNFEPTVWQKLVMLLCGEYVKRCPQCQTEMTLKLVYHVITTDRKTNLKKEIWEKG